MHTVACFDIFAHDAVRKCVKSLCRLWTLNFSTSSIFDFKGFSLLDVPPVCRSEIITGVYALEMIYTGTSPNGRLV